MRTSNYGKIKITKKTLGILIGILVVLLVAGGIFFFTYFRVTKVEVMENDHYTEDELKEMVLKGAFASNSILAPITCSKSNLTDVPYLEAYNVTRSGRNTIVVSARDKSIAGCIQYLDSYIYFDRNGMFAESDKERDESIPFFKGIDLDKAIKGEKLPIKDSVLNTAVALSTIFAKNDMTPDYVALEDDYSIDLIYSDITVKLGKDQYLEDKMARTVAILPKITGQKGILHVENVTDSSKTITFEKEVDETTTTKTTEEWNGGYDENGDYTGDGEYDEEGNYVGAKPESTDTTSDTSTDESNESGDSDESDEDYSEDYSDEDYSDYSDYSDDTSYDDYSDYEEY